jgi:hypothetical protein
MREKELGDEQVRVTVRLPQGLYDAVRATRRQRWGWGAWNISLIIRDALQHYLTLQHRLANISPDLGIQRIDGGSKLTITTDRARRDMIFRRQLLNSTARNVIIIGTFFRPSLALFRFKIAFTAYVAFLFRGKITSPQLVTNNPIDGLLTTGQ